MFLVVKKYNVRKNLASICCEASCFCHACDEFSERYYVNKHNAAAQILELLFAQCRPDL